MSDKEYQEFIRLFLRLKYLLKKHDEFLDITSEKDNSEPIMIPADIYDDICEVLGKNEIGLMGIS